LNFLKGYRCKLPKGADDYGFESPLANSPAIHKKDRSKKIEQIDLVSNSFPNSIFINLRFNCQADLLHFHINRAGCIF